MKVIKAKILGIDKITVKDKNTNKTADMYHYYISIGDCNVMGVKVDSCYSTNLINT